MHVIVVGLGIVGVAIADRLARRGWRVTGFDRYAPPHASGSSHGESRVIREAYFEDPVYVPLVQRAYELWRELERDAGEALLRTTGALMLGDPAGPLVQGTLRSVAQHGLRSETLTGSEVARRFPALRPPTGMTGVYEERGGVLAAEACVAAQLRSARAHGATLRTGETVAGWDLDADGVVVRAAAGELRASHLVLAAGPWLAELVPALPLTVERQVLFWFPAAPPVAHCTPERMPVFLVEQTDGSLFYGVPDLGGGVKLARHHGGETGATAHVREQVGPDDVAPVRAFARRWLPTAVGADPVRAVVCRYTNTPDAHFLVDHHPGSDRVWLASPCSGHGFKFAPAIAELIADRLEQRVPRFDLAPFRLARFLPA